MQELSWKLLDLQLPGSISFGRSSISFVDRLLLGNIFTLFGFAVEA